jgi:hypothetical protein
LCSLSLSSRRRASRWLYTLKLKLDNALSLDALAQLFHERHALGFVVVTSGHTIQQRGRFHLTHKSWFQIRVRLGHELQAVARYGRVSVRDSRLFAWCVVQRVTSGKQSPPISHAPAVSQAIDSRERHHAGLARLHRMQSAPPTALDKLEPHVWTHASLHGMQLQDEAVAS